MSKGDIINLLPYGSDALVHRVNICEYRGEEIHLQYEHVAVGSRDLYGQAHGTLQRFNVDGYTTRVCAVGPVDHMAASGSEVAIATGKTVTLWDARSGITTRKYDFRDPILSFDMLPSGVLGVLTRGSNLDIIDRHVAYTMHITTRLASNVKNLRASGNVFVATGILGDPTYHILDSGGGSVAAGRVEDLFSIGVGMGCIFASTTGGIISARTGGVSVDVTNLGREAHVVCGADWCLAMTDAGRVFRYSSDKSSSDKQSSDKSTNDKSTCDKSKSDNQSRHI